tara:strand:+ start:1622 stop:4015 length:2394 start_codon:yes stop_codon:yes gene_type:complete
MSVLGNAAIDRITGTGSSNLAFVDRNEDGFGQALSGAVREIRENRSGTQAFVKRRQDAIDALIEYLKNQGMDEEKAKAKALDTYNYLLDNPTAAANAGATPVKGFPDVLNIGGGALIKEYERSDIKTPVLTQDKTIKALSDSYVTSDPEDFERSTMGAIFNPFDEAVKRGTVQAAEAFDTTPEALTEEISNPTADFLRTGIDALAFDTIDDNSKIDRDGSVIYSRTIYSPKTTVDSMNAAKVELYPSLARNFNLDSKVSITGSTISIEPLENKKIGGTGPLANILQTDFGTVLALTDELIGARFARNGAVDVDFINHLRARSQDVAPAINQIRSVFADIGVGGKGRLIREAADLYLANLNANKPNAAETARANLDSMLKKEFAMFGGEIPELIETSPQMAQMIVNGQVPTNTIKNVALHIFNQDSQTTELDVQTSRRSVTDEELLKKIQDTGGDLSDERFAELQGTIEEQQTQIAELRQTINETVKREEIKQKEKESPLVTTAKDIQKGIDTVRNFKGTDASRIANARRDLAGIRNKIAVAIEKGNSEKVKQFVKEANDIRESVADIDSQEIDSAFTSIQDLIPAEFAENMWHGGTMLSDARHRFNKGGIMRPAPTGFEGSDTTTVTGKRETEPSIDVGMSLMSQIGRGIDTSHPESPDSTFDPDLYESAMMEDDEGYDEAYNFTQKMRDKVKKQATDKLDAFEAFINDPLKTAEQKGIDLENTIRNNLEKIDFLDIVDEDTLNYKDRVESLMSQGDSKGKAIFKSITTNDPLDAFVGDIFKGIFGSKNKKEEKTSE